MLPHKSQWDPVDARLTWQQKSEGKLEVKGFRRVLKVSLDHESRGPSWLSLLTSNNKQQPRAPPSGATPSALLRSPKNYTVEEVRLLRSHWQLVRSILWLLPQDFLALSNDELVKLQLDDGADRKAKPPLATRDAELLLSYLSVPYLRIPLLLNFFADQQRLDALGSTRMQEVLESAIFEPGAWQGTCDRRVPTEVPVLKAEERTVLLATPLGLLMNELLMAPTLVLKPLERLMEMALDMDTGAVSGDSARIIFFVVRLAMRVESHVNFIHQHFKEWGGTDSMPDSQNISLPVESESLAAPAGKAVNDSQVPMAVSEEEDWNARFNASSNVSLESSERSMNRANGLFQPSHESGLLSPRSPSWMQDGKEKTDVKELRFSINDEVDLSR